MDGGVWEVSCVDEIKVQIVAGEYDCVGREGTVFFITFVRNKQRFQMHKYLWKLTCIIIQVT